MIPPPRFTFTRVAIPSLGAIAAAVCVALFVRKPRPEHSTPDRHPDRAIRLSRRDRAMWRELEGLLDCGVPDTLLRDVGLDILDPEDGPC